MAMCICIRLMLICIAVVEGKIEWKVERKVTAYGQDLVLFCKIENCCIAQAGWSVGYTPIYLDVRHFIENAKYDAGINRTGITLIIKRLTKDDLNKTYFCTHGFEDSTKKVLGENDAFLSSVQEHGKDLLIIAVCVGVIVITIIVTSIVVCIWWKRRKHTREDKGNTVEIQLLSDNPEGNTGEKQLLSENPEGNTVERQLLSENPEAVPSVIAEAGGRDLIAGANFAEHLINPEVYNVTCKIVVHNHTKFDLTQPSAHTDGGYLDSSLVIIQSGHKEIFVARKYGYTLTGTYGTASWLVDQMETRVVIMWSCPYNFDFYKNWLAVGLTSEKMEHDNKWYDEMYNKKTINNMQYDLKEFHNDIKEAQIKSDKKKIKVTGIMSTGHQATVDIKVMSIEDKE